jgi:hypothetical protein
MAKARGRGAPELAVGRFGGSRLTAAWNGYTAGVRPLDSVGPHPGLTFSPGKLARGKIRTATQKV